MRLTEKAEGATEKLAAAVRQALAEAKESLANVATPGQLNEFMREFVGPMVVREDGSIARLKVSVPDDEAARDGCDKVGGG